MSEETELSEEETNTEESGEALVPTEWLPGQHAYLGPRSNSLLLLGEINQETSSALITQLNSLSQLVEEPITLFINTEGGSVVDAFAIHDFIKQCQLPIIGVVIGNCFSAGLTVLAACDYRIMTANSMLFYHEVIMSSSSSSEIETKSMAAYYEMLNGRNNEIIRKRAKLTQSKWKKEFQGHRSKFMTSEEALAYGLIDEVMEPPKKNFKIEPIGD